MINYRKYDEDDFEQINDLCKKHDLAIPVNSDLLFVAANDEENIIGIGGIKTVVQINPLISENPLVATSLWNHLSGALQSMNIDSCQLLVDKDNYYLQELYKKVGFNIKESNKIIMEKYFNGGKCK